MAIKCRICGKVNEWIDPSDYYQDEYEQLLMHLKSKHMGTYAMLATGSFEVLKSVE